MVIIKTVTALFMIKINIGCGRDYREGWLNVDISKDCKADAYLDIRKNTLSGSWYGEQIDGGAEEVYISGVLEQIGSNEEFIHALNECWRVLKNGGIITIVVPNAKYAIAHRDPMDIRKFTHDTFRYFIDGTQEYNHYGSVYGFKPWHALSIEENQRHILTVTMRK